MLALVQYRDKLSPEEQANLEQHNKNYIKLKNKVDDISYSFSRDLLPSESSFALKSRVEELKDIA